MTVFRLPTPADLPSDQELVLIRGVLILALIMTLVSIVFRMGVSIGAHAAADELQWQMALAKRASPKETPPENHKDGGAAG